MTRAPGARARAHRGARAHLIPDLALCTLRDGLRRRDDSPGELDAPNDRPCDGQDECTCHPDPRPLQSALDPVLPRSSHRRHHEADSASKHPLCKGPQPRDSSSAGIARPREGEEGVLRLPFPSRRRRHCPCRWRRAVERRRGGGRGESERHFTLVLAAGPKPTTATEPLPRDGGVRGWCMARPVYVARGASQQDALQARD
eukprot:scaffold22819_cov28-Tisochrysis_lutea.AAC.1